MVFLLLSAHRRTKRAETALAWVTCSCPSVRITGHAASSTRLSSFGRVFDPPGVAPEDPIDGVHQLIHFGPMALERDLWKIAFHRKLGFFSNHSHRPSGCSPRDSEDDDKDASDHDESDERQTGRAPGIVHEFG